jgi:hypothetical protein
MQLSLKYFKKIRLHHLALALLILAPAPRETAIQADAAIAALIYLK